jgi:hypothetical protein
MSSKWEYVCNIVHTHVYIQTLIPGDRSTNTCSLPTLSLQCAPHTLALSAALGLFLLLGPIPTPEHVVCMYICIFTYVMRIRIIAFFIRYAIYYALHYTALNYTTHYTIHYTHYTIHYPTHSPLALRPVLLPSSCVHV